jgi:hypothetical protein
MKTLADNWTAAGSIATGFGAIAAFLAIAATLYVYWSQSRGNKAAAIRQNLQFIHSLQTQVTRSIESGFLATIDMQIRQFRERLGPDAKPSYFLDQLFDNSQAPDDRPLFKASALESNLSSTMYIRMSDIWDRMNMKAVEFRGALRIFSYASYVLTQEARRLCEPNNTTRILDLMKKRGAMKELSKINSLDELVNTLLSDQIKLASDQLKHDKDKIEQGCHFILTLSDKTLPLKNKKLLKLASMNVDPLGFDQLDKNPRKAIEDSLCKLPPTLPDDDFRCLRTIVACWNPRPPEIQLAEPPPSETGPS